jgi:hypothetical protein
MALIAALKRRKVFRVGIACLIATPTLLAQAAVQAGELKRMEFPLDGAWHVADTSKDENWPVMVAMKIDDQYRQNSPILVMSCEKTEGIQVYINWSSGRVLEKNRWVTYEIDGEQPVRGLWDLSADGYATFFPHYSPTVAEASGLQLPSDFAEQLIDSKRLVASVIIGRETPKVAGFTLKGARQALEEIRAGCGQDDLTNTGAGNF